MRGEGRAPSSRPPRPSPSQPWLLDAEVEGGQPQARSEVRKSVALMSPSPTNIILLCSPGLLAKDLWVGIRERGLLGFCCPACPLFLSTSPHPHYVMTSYKWNTIS